MLLSFVTRSIFIFNLGRLYLGLNGLFSSVLTMLSLAELGFGAAMVYSLYGPIANKETQKICALLNLYKKIYQIIGLFILLVGLILSFFIHNLVKGELPDGVNLYIVYLISLSNTVLSYFLFAYKQSLFIADQRSDILNLISSVIIILMNVVQITILINYKNYYLYLIIHPFFTIINNLLIYYISNKKYPSYRCKGNVSLDVKKDIKKRVSGLFLYKICNVLRDSIDNIYISSFIGLAALGTYNNYLMIFNIVSSFVLILKNSIIAIIGNSIVKESEDKNYRDFNILQLLFMWGSIWASTCIFCLSQQFITVWLGKNYLMPTKTVFLLALLFFAYRLGDLCAIYRHAAGLWWFDKARPVVETIIKSILALILIRMIQIDGLIISTVLCLLFINSIWAAVILYKHYFIHQKIFNYIKNNIFYLLVAIVVMVVTYKLCCFIEIKNQIINLLIKSLICILIPNFLLSIILRILPEYSQSIKFMYNTIRAKIQ